MLRWGDFPGLSGWANVITKALVIGRKVSQRKGLEDAILLALKMDGETTSQGKLLLGAGKRGETNILLESPESTSLTNTLTLAQ